ncbi:choice-of-anchor J domain-containing protein [Flavobacterium paronense]|uniref:Choice-of-anchor J domain-containing protein n=1 Tax=Flavobacterium paronense TaxID=1392775 RepID=A0ABV5GF03_9FLAO|nr:choice-of-anchor J domain-containing protein [Flavobacterium paronense]MDN3678527.1 choice-of-anchor J domain-containing protein [Flavobacterium paronense]
MKNYKKIVLVFLALLPFTGCSPENDIKIADFTKYAFYEEFLGNTTDGSVLNITGWTNYAQVGTVKWNEGLYSGTKYAEFTSYQSGQASNIAWLVSPAINMDTMNNETLAFDVAQAYVSSSSNSIELLVSTDYDGTNVMTASWQTLSFKTPPLNYDTNFTFFSSGLVDLSSYTGNIYIAFKCKGSGTNTSLDGTYELDNVRIFDKK